MERRCESCGVNVLDPAGKCPLCRRALAPIDADSMRKIEPTYPLTKRKTYRGRNALWIYAVAAIAAFVIILHVNYLMQNDLWWTFLIGLFMIYGYITLFFSLKKQIGHQPKMMMQSLLAVLLVLFIDYSTGFRGWSLNYVYPGLLAFLDLLILMLMLINKRNWQSYIIMQLWVVILAVAPFVLYVFGLVDHLRVPWIIFVCVILVFVATLLIGGSRARSEMARRFHR